MSSSAVCGAKNCGLSLEAVPGLRLFKFPESKSKKFTEYGLIDEERCVLLIWRKVAQLSDDAVGEWLCERHFKRSEFDIKGTGLVTRAVPSYPTGEFNLLTGNYCPTGREHLDWIENPVPVSKRVPISKDKTTTPAHCVAVHKKNAKLQRNNDPSMAQSCLVTHCSNNENMGRVSLFGLPLNDKELLKKWIAVIPLKHWQPNEWHRICSAHFTTDSLMTSADGLVVPVKDAVPSIFNRPPAIIIPQCPEDTSQAKTPPVGLINSTSRTDFIPMVSVNGEMFHRKSEIMKKISEISDIGKDLSKTISKFKEALSGADVSSVMRYLNKKDKAESSIFLDLFVAKKCPVLSLEVGSIFKKRKRARIETKSKVMEFGNCLEVSLPKPLPILERMLSEDDLVKRPIGQRDLYSIPLDHLLDELNMKNNQIDVLYAGLFEIIEKYFSKEGIKNPYIQYCCEGIKAAVKKDGIKAPVTNGLSFFEVETLEKNTELIIDAALILMFFCPKIYYSLEMCLPPLTEVLRGKSEFGSSPGFTINSFEELGKEPNRALVSLSFLELSLDTEVLWDGTKLRGYCDYGFDAPRTDNIAKASTALLFFATCLKTDFRLPLGYHIIDHVTAPVIANITKCYMIRLSQSGIRCCAFVCEPEAKSLDVVKCLGFNHEFLHGSEVGDTWFLHPFDNTQRVYCFFDSFRLCQQAGYLLVERGNLTVNNLHSAYWTYLTDLETIIDDTVRNDCKISKTVKLNYEWGHIVDKLDSPSFFLNKARSAALTFCSRPGVAKMGPNARGTIVFIDRINAFYDCCSSTKTQDCRPVSKTTKDEVKSKIKELTIFFWNMWVKNDFAGTPGRQLPISGIILNLSNLSKLILEYEQFFEDETVEMYTSRMNMTRLDEFVGKIKVAGNYSSPFVFQKNYESELKKLIEAQKVVPSS